MLDSRGHILVGHDGDLTFVGIHVDAESGSFWDKILPLVRGRHLVLDLSGVGSEPSSFIQEVLMLASVLQRRETRLWLSRVPASVVRKLGARSAAISGTSCLSLEAPFFCTVCETEASVLLDMKPELLRTGTHDEGILNKQRCSKCFSAMQFNAMPEMYFKFMERMEAPLGLGSLRSLAENALASSVRHELASLEKPEADLGGPKTERVQPVLEPGDTSLDHGLAWESFIAAALLILDVALLWSLV